MSVMCVDSSCSAYFHALRPVGFNLIDVRFYVVQVSMMLESRRF